MLTGSFKLVKDAEIRYGSGSTGMVSFAVPVKRYNKETKSYDLTTWYNFAWFGDYAVKQAEYLKKDAVVHVAFDDNGYFVANNGNVSYNWNVRQLNMVSWANSTTDNNSTNDYEPDNDPF